MNDPQNRTPESAPGLTWLWSAIAALAGLLCVALPPFFAPGPLKTPHYGVARIPWFATAFANLQFDTSMIAIFFVGLALGYARPRAWWRLGGLTLVLPFILQAINIEHDLARDPTTHNLLPFEFVMIAYLCWPVFPAAFIAARVRAFARPAVAA